MDGEQWALLPTILQGGSFCLLAMMFLWAMYWLPKWRTEANARADAQRQSAETVAAAHTRAVELIEAAHDARLQKLLETFVADQRYEREQCATLFRSLEEGQRRQLAGLEQVIRALPGRPGRRDQT